MAITTHVPLNDKNWFKTGGHARYFSNPSSIEALQDALAFAHDNNMPIFFLGSGANCLISDHGFNGLVLQPQLGTLKKWSHDDSFFVTASSDIHFSDLITFCFDNNLLGLEEFSGIPGTVGGSVFINIHYYEFLLDHFFHQATVIDRKTGSLEIVDHAWFNFSYNTSRLHHDIHYLVDATFRVLPAQPLQTAFARGRCTEIIRHRARRYPTAGTCGSFFRNFYAHEIEQYKKDAPLSVAFYLDKVGVKGSLRIGDACVSYQHANMIINYGNAKTNDILEVARTMQQRVYDAFGILPEPECRLIGFETYPLLTESSL